MPASPVPAATMDNATVTDLISWLTTPNNQGGHPDQVMPHDELATGSGTSIALCGQSSGPPR